jgi:outer membrane protein TolC
MRRIEEMLSMKLLSALLATSLLTGCTVGPDYHKPDVALTAAYHAPTAIAPAEAQWWKRFNDPVLDALVDQALAQNMDIAAAAARITQARGVARAAGAALLPTVGVGPRRSVTGPRCRRPWRGLARVGLSEGLFALSDGRSGQLGDRPFRGPEARA